MRCHLRPDRTDPDKEFASIVIPPEEVDGFRAALLSGLKKAETGRVIDLFGHVTKVTVSVEFLRPCSPDEPAALDEGRPTVAVEKPDGS